MRLYRTDLCAADEGQLRVTCLGAGVDHATVEGEAITRLADTGLGIDGHLHAVAGNQVHLAVAITDDTATGGECQRACTVDSGDLQLTQRHVALCIHAQCACCLHVRTVAHAQAVGPGNDAVTRYLAAGTQLQHLARIQQD